MRVVALSERPIESHESGDETLVADLRDFDSLCAALREARPGCMVHLAGQSSAALSFEQPRETFGVNAAGTIHLLEAARAECPKARVLVVGSGESYGPQPEGSRVGEEARFRPVSPYGLSKAVADTAAETYARVFGLDIVRTRSFAHVGPGQSPRFAVPSFARQVAEAEAGLAEPVLRVGNLQVTRDLTDVRDVARAYGELLEHGRAGEAYNVCSGQGVILADVVHRLAAMARVEVRVELDPARLRPADVPYLVGDPSRIEAGTGWRRTVPLDRSLGDVLDECRARVAAPRSTGP
jgi:GDP-4-dehydro-6-deoxy-D-mannose reductase